MQPSPHLPAAPPRVVDRRLPQVVGLLLVLPAAFALLVGYGWPTLQTGWRSLLDGNAFGGDRDFVGLDNYQRLLDLGGVRAVGFGLSLAAIPLLVILVIAPLLAVAAHYAGRPMRLVTRLALTLPMVVFAPVGLAIAWRIDRFQADSAPLTVRAATGLTLFGLICAIAVTVYLAALRRREPDQPAPADGRRWSALAAVAGFGAIATIAVSLQAFTYPYVVTGGGPSRRTATPLLDSVAFGIMRLDFGVGHAQAVLVLVPVLVLGLAATLLVILTRLRIELDPAGRPGTAVPGPPGVARPPAPAGRFALAILGAVLGLVVVLAVTLYGLWPLLSRLTDYAGFDAAQAGRTLLRTWAPPLVTTTLGVGLAALAGFGIGALRPLGERSEWLLLLFAPWLFVGVGPLFITKYESAALGLIDRIDTWLGSLLPVWVVIPALLVFTLLFRGLTQQAAAGHRPPGYGSMLVAALPMVVLVGAATYLVQAQSLLWPLLMSRTEASAPVAVLQSQGLMTFQGDYLLALLLPIPLVLLFAAGLALLQWLYLDRVAIRIGRPGL